MEACQLNNREISGEIEEKVEEQKGYEGIGGAACVDPAT
jgi:hypothetical protein